MLSTAGYHGAEPGYHEPESELDKKVSATSFRSALTRDQEHQVNELYDAVEGDLQGHPDLQAWCTRTTLKRYLVARQWDQAAAAKMLRATFDWRKSYRPGHITWDDIKEEATTGKQYICSCPDREGRPVIVMRPRCENTKNAERQMKYLVYHLEMASRMADEAGGRSSNQTCPMLSCWLSGVQRVVKMTWLVDFVGYSLRTAPPVRTQIQTTQMLQNHYPERLGLAVCYHAPRLFSLAYKATRPFIDPITFKKIVFVDGSSAAIMDQKFDMTKMEACLGGTSEWTFNLASYAQQAKKEEAGASGAGI